MHESQLTYADVRIKHVRVWVSLTKKILFANMMK